MGTTIQLACASIGTHDAWTLTAGATKVIAVAQPDDDATTVIRTSTLNAKQSFNLDNLPGGASAIVSVTTVARFNESAASATTMRAFLLLAGVTENGTTRNPGAAYTTYSEAIAKPGGGTWSVADVNALEVGVEEVADSIETAGCTTLYVEVVYDSAGSDFAVFLTSLLPPLLAVFEGIHRCLLSFLTQPQ